MKSKVDKGRISGSQFMLAIACFIQSSALLTTFIVDVSYQDSWLVVLLGGVVCLPLIWVFRTLMVMFPGRSLLGILEEVYGKWGGRALSALYLWFFLTLTAVNFMDLAEFSKLTIMDKTPSWALALMCMLVASLAVREGVGLVTKYCGIFVVISFAIMLVSLLMGYNEMKLENLLPMFDQPLMRYVQGVHITATIPFGELVVFLMVNPNLKLSSKQMSKYFYLAFGMGGIVVLAATIRDITVLGNMLDLFVVPSMVTLRLFNKGMALGRIEILFSIALIMLLFFKITFLYYVTVLTAAEVFGVKEYRHLVLAMGIFLVTYGLTLYTDFVKHVISAQQIVPFLWAPVEILIPILTLVVAKLRKLPKRKEA